MATPRTLRPRPGGTEEVPIRPGPRPPVRHRPPLRPPTTESATQPIDGDGRARGCRRPGSIAIGIPGLAAKDVGGVIPSWVQATSAPRVRDHRDRPRVAEGVVMRSHISGEDFPLAPWHTSYDWNFHVRLDPAYRNLLSTANVRAGGLLECEWEEHFLPAWARPWGRHRVWVLGRWIFDCGHPDDHNEYRTEIHPPRAVATFHPDVVRMPGNSGPTAVNSAVLYIGAHGGYWDSDITDQDYEFSFAMPPRPSAGAVPKVRIRAMTGRLPVRPRVTFTPAGRRPTMATVHVSLEGVRPKPEEYGAVISVGWSDPTGSAAARVVRRRITVEKLFMDANLDPIGNDEWYMYLGVNGRWRDLRSQHGDSVILNWSVNVDLDRDQDLVVSCSGFEADTVHDLMGHSTSVQPSEVSHPSSDTRARQIAGVIRDKFGAHINENDRVSRLEEVHRATETGHFKVRAPGKDYRLQYTIR